MFREELLTIIKEQIELYLNEVNINDRYFIFSERIYSLGLKVIYSPELLGIEHEYSCVKELFNDINNEIIQEYK